MFNKSVIAIALGLITCGPAHAIFGGEAISPVDNAQIVKLHNCTGTVVAGKYIITAAHCGDGSGSMANIGNSNVAVTKTYTHPLYDGSSPRIFDVAIWEMASAAQKVGYVSVVEPVIGQTYSIAGWQGGALKQAGVVAKGPANPAWSEDAYELVYDPVNGMGTGNSLPGDSGGPCGDSAGVWGVIQGAGGQGDGTTLQSCQRLSNVNTKQWLLETINSWSYPTSLEGAGVLTVKIQNLHAVTDSLTPWVEGAVEIVGNNCPAAVEPFGVCEYRVQGNGKLHLTATDSVEINKQVTPPEPPKPEENGGGGGGGSVGIFGLFALAVMAVRRNMRIFK